MRRKRRYTVLYSINDLPGRVDSIRFEFLVQELEAEVGRLAREVELLRRQLEQETLQRTDAENKLKTQQEELVFRTRFYEQEAQEIRTRTLETHEVDGRLQQV